MGFNPSESPQTVIQNADALVKLLYHRTGVPIRALVATDYNTLISSLGSGQVDFAWLSPVGYVEAERLADAHVLLRAVRGGRSFFHGCLVVRSDSPYRSVRDLRGKRIAWVDPVSASGYVYPKAALLRQGIQPETFFARQTFAGGHDAVLKMVLARQVEAGATYCGDAKGSSGSWREYLKGSDSGSIRPVFVTEPIPGDTLSTTHRFLTENSSMVSRVTEALKGLHKSPEGRRVLKDLYHIDHLEDAVPADYEIVRQYAKILDLGSGQK